MGEKRGSYRKYNSKELKRVGAMQPNTREALIASGMNMRSRVAREPSKHFIGEQMVLFRRTDKDGSLGPTLEGRVIGIYPHFLLISCGNYKATATYKDLVLGGRIYA